MRRTNLPLLVVIVAVATAIAACSEKPAAPTYDNPFDPDGDGPDPYELTAQVEGDSVRLEWKDTPAVSRWQVYHSTISDTELNLLPTIVVTRGGASAEAVHRDYSPGRTNWYRVQAIGEGEQPTSLLLGDPAMVMPPPLVRLAGGSSTTATRFVQLEVRSDVGDQLELSNLEDFSSSTVVDLTFGTITTVDWTLPRVDAFPTDLSIYFRVLDAGSVGESGELVVEARVSPLLDFARGVRFSLMGTDVVDTVVVIEPSGQGVTGLRTVVDGGDTTVVADPFAPVTLRPSVAAADTIVFEAFFANDLGPEVRTSVTLVPNTDVGAATMSIGLVPRTSTRDIEVQLTSVGAGYVRLSEDPGFGGAAFQLFADTVPFTLSEGAGDKTIYGEFVNPWDPAGETASLTVTLEGSR